MVSQTGELFPCVDWSEMCQVGRQVGGWSAKQVSRSPVWTGQ